MLQILEAIQRIVKNDFSLGFTQNNGLAQCLGRRGHCTKLPPHPLDNPDMYNEITRVPSKVN